MRAGSGLLLVCGFLLVVSFTAAQPPGGQGKGKGKGPKGGDKGGAGQSETVTQLTASMMAFDKNGDGKVAKDEVIDERLSRLFDQADANADGFVTRDELATLTARLQAQVGQGGDRGGKGDFGGKGGKGDFGDKGKGGKGDFGGKGKGGKGDFGGKGKGDRGGKGKGGPDGPGGRGGPPDRGGPGGQGPGGFGGPPMPGQILPPPVQDMLNLTAEQRRQLDELQKDVDGRLEKLLTDDQKQQLRQFQDGRGRRGGRGFGG